MGTLNKYLNAAAVEEALDKGVAAYSQAEQNETDILSVQGDINGFLISSFVGREIGRNTRYINADGSTTSSGSHKSFIYDLSEIRAIDKVVVFGTDLNLLGIAFYSSLTTFNAETFIRGYALANRTSKDGDKYTFENVEIPTGAVSVVISNRFASGTEIVFDCIPYAKALQISENEKICKSNEEKVNRILDEAISTVTVWTALENGTQHVGKMVSYATGSMFDDASMCSTVLPCEPNKEYKLDGYNIGYDQHYPIVFLDSKGKVINYIADSVRAYERVVTTPDNCVEIRYTQLWNNSSYRSYYGQYIGSSSYFDAYDRLKDVNLFRNPKGTIGEYIIGNDANGKQTVRNGSDSTIINKDGVDYKITFFSGDDALETAVELKIQAFENGYDKQATFSCTCSHKFGHCNTVDYNPHNDCLIFGNGSGDYSLLGKFYIIPNAKALFVDNVTSGQEFTLENTGAIEFDCAGYDFGTKLNALWGEQNGFKNDIAYLITNDNGTIRRIVLGTGTNQLTYGSYTETSEGVFNGTFDVLKTYTHDGCEYRTCNQGSQYYHGKILCGIGHSGIKLWAITLNDENEKAYADEYVHKFYNQPTSVSMNGVCIDKNDNLIIGTTLLNDERSTMALIYKNVSMI